ncbi:lipase family protein [Rhodococcus kroppenstedtii]|uniref:lipase family protein n=1 Tax=Rhodococcoides kroppenstedtii TaxID=293050 RepID=UPI002955934C|nr:lipase family protein [Rhodococcus kroppenstedtii]MDV7196608.1 lipase family protein [Rhodococcus kroppenstedtii]
MSSIVDVLTRLGLADRVPAEVLADPYAALLPTPITSDPFFVDPSAADAPSTDVPPGTVLRNREITGLVPRPRTRLRQFAVASRDAQGRPVTVTASLMEPRRPWRGPGPRPVLVHNVAIDSLGLAATPSYRLVHGLGQDFPAVVPLWLQRGYAVLIVDHEGPRMAYAEGTMAGHAVLDGLRGLPSLDETYRDSPAVMYGYSGGAIATVWAAQLQPHYAPEVPLIGAIAGGTPTNVGLLRETMNGTIASGLFGAAVIGLAREHEALAREFGPLGLYLATRIKNLSVIPLALGGLARLPLEALAHDPNVFDSPVARAVIEANTPGATAPAVPFAFYHGARDRWIPEHGVRRLADDWRAQGADVEVRRVVGDHFVGSVSALPFVTRWVAARFTTR